jgi:hypothetical protein
VTGSTTIPSAPLRLLPRRGYTYLAALAVAAVAACGDNGVGPLGPPAGLAVVAGANQQGTVGDPVPEPPSVQVRDAEGRGVPGISVKFDVVSGGGAVTGDSVVTNDDGIATVGEWRLGPLPGINTLRAQTIDHPYQLTITATAGVGAPSSIQIVSGGANLAAVVGQEVLPRPTVRVRDAFGNPVPGVTITWVVVEGGGSLTGPNTSVTDAEGRATVSGWRLGPASGVNRLQARTANGIVATFTANGIGVPASIIAESPTSQEGFINFAVPKTARVRVIDGFGADIVGLPVVFKITSGTGTIIGDTVITDSDGIAALGDWKLGASGFVQVTATVPGFTGPSMVFTASGPARAFTIDVRFLSIPPADLRDAYVAGALRWMSVIIGDLPDRVVNRPSAWDCFGSTTFPMPPMSETIDDVVIFARIVPIDGPSNILAQAGACDESERPGSLLTAIGGMKFDVDDATSLHSTGKFVDVVTHEMGHVLGLYEGRYKALGLVTGLATLTPAFVGNAALAAWPSLGIAYSGPLVPLEECCGGGTAIHHWDEEILGNELMTGFIEIQPGAVMPLSAITVGAMADIGYLVDPASADPFIASLRAETPIGTRVRIKEIIHVPKRTP